MYRSIFFASTICCLTLSAAPEGFHLAAGDAKPPVSDGAGTTTIESGKRAVINWNSFSIGEKEAVRFNQLDSHSAVLNRVVGFSDSKIYGHLFSNGKVYLVNKNGVVIGPQGRIETAGFVASTHDLLNEDFLKGKEMMFQGFSEAAVVNLGTIEAIGGDILLIGTKVTNQGTLKAADGHVGIGVGKEVFVQPEGRERIFVRIPADASEDPALEHSGMIQALSAELKSGGRPYSKAIKFSGKAEVLSTVEEGGHIYLVADDGVAEFSGDIEAKEVRILGKEVYLHDQAHIDVSSDQGGGSVLIGGDFKGENPEIRNAERTFVGPEVRIEADALVAGDGGKVVVWSDEATAFYGTISAKGGPEAGDGGFVEVSGKQLFFGGFADLQAVNGKTGLLYLDPTDVVIGAGGCAVTFGNPTTWPIGCCPTIQILSMGVGSLSAALGAANVTIDTSAAVDCGIMGAGLITVNGDIVWASGNTLTLIGDTGIDFNTPSVSGSFLDLQTRAGNLTVTDSDIAVSGTITLNIAGGVSVTSSNFGGISELGGLSGVSGTIGGDVVVSSTNGYAAIGSATSGAGPIDLTIGGNLTLTSTNGAATAAIGYDENNANGNITLNVNGNVNVQGFIDTGISLIGHRSLISNSGNLTLTSQTGSVTVESNNGGAAVIGFFARAPHAPPNNVTVIAAQNVNLTTTVSTDISIIVGAATLSQGNVTVVVDNAFPSSVGPGGINVSGPGLTQFLAASPNQLSIYTATPAQNTFGSTINNVAFSAQPLGSDNSYQQFGVFYPGGTYTGPQYMVFYKATSTPSPTPTPTPTINNTTVATTAVTNILTPTNTSNTTILQGPASQTNSNDPVDDQAHHTPYNDDNRGGQQCH
jgi:filamentous hemagglutinin family protein